MKKAFLSLLFVAASAAFAVAGPSGAGKHVVIDKNPAVVPAPCYAGGYEFGIFGAGFIPDGGGHYDDSFGGGVSVGYFYNANFGFDFSAAVFGTDSAVHNYTLDAVYRLPMDCLAPYVLVGGGVHANSATAGIFRFGGGVDYRFTEGMSLFADGIYSILGDDVEDYTTVRAGIRFQF